MLLSALILSSCGKESVSVPSGTITEGTQTVSGNSSDSQEEKNLEELDIQDDIYIEGHGTVKDTTEGDVPSSVEFKSIYSGSTSSGKDSITNKYWEEEMQKHDYVFRAKSDISQGFSVKQADYYNIYPDFVMDNYAELHGPDSSIIKITELNYHEVDLDKARENILLRHGLSEYANYVSPESINYGCKYVTLGIGITNWPPTEYGPDSKVNSMENAYNDSKKKFEEFEKQCDDKIESYKNDASLSEDQVSSKVKEVETELEERRAELDKINSALQEARIEYASLLSNYEQR